MISLLKFIGIWFVILIPAWFIASITAAQYDPMLWPVNVREGFAAFALFEGMFVGMGAAIYWIARYMD